MRAAKTMDYLVVLCMGLNITEVVFPGKWIMNALGFSMGKNDKDINLAFIKLGILSGYKYESTL